MGALSDSRSKSQGDFLHCSLLCVHFSIHIINISYYINSLSMFWKKENIYNMSLFLPARIPYYHPGPTECRGISCTRWMCCLTTYVQGIFHHHCIRCMSSLYILTSILKAHTYWLTSSAWHIQLSAFLSVPPTNHQATCQLKKREREREQVGLLYKLDTQTLQKLRLPTLLRCSAEQRSGPVAEGLQQARGFFFFLLWHGCLDEGQRES